MKYKYKTVTVNNADDFVNAIDKGNMVINVPQRFRQEVFERMEIIKKQNDDYLFAYASCLFYFLDTVSKKREAFDIATKLANKGNAKGYLALGYYHWRFNHDNEQAISWFQKGADKGEILCVRWLGVIYNVEKDYAKAFFYYNEACKKGLTCAKYDVAFSYHHGEGVEKDPRKAFDLMLEAAKEGHSNAQEFIANAYRDGKVVEQSVNDALYWYLTAASNGNRHAMDLLLEQYSLDHIFSRLKIKKPNE